MSATIRILVPLALSFAALQAHAQQQVGRVLLAAGDAVAVRGGQTVRLALGSEVQDRDVLRTGPASSLQVRFNDESITSLRENSELNIEQFHFTGKEDGSERAVFRLLKGGLRTITGLVGRTNKSNYSLSSMTSTIGIRGSDFSIRACQQDCIKGDGTRERDGVFGSVHGISPASGSNAINVANPVTNLNVGINQHFYDNGKVIERLLSQPEVVTSGPRGTAIAKGPATGKEQTTSGGAGQDGRSTAVPGLTTPLTFVAPGAGDPIFAPPVGSEIGLGGSTSPGGLGGSTSPGGVPLVQPTLGAVAAYVNGLGQHLSDGAYLTPSMLTFNMSGALSGLNIPTGTPLISPAGAGVEPPGVFASAAAIAEFGLADPGDGSINARWVRWNSGTLTDGDGTTMLPGGFHGMVGNLAPAEVVAAKTGTFVLSPLGGTTPTNNLGQAALGFNYPTVTINFLNRTAAFSPFSWSFSSNSWSFPAGTGSVVITPGVGAGVSASYSGGGCSGTGCGFASPLPINAQVTGSFYGPKGDHLGTAIAGSSGTARSMGTQLYTCAPSC